MLENITLGVQKMNKRNSGWNVICTIIRLEKGISIFYVTLVDGKSRKGMPRQWVEQ